MTPKDWIDLMHKGDLTTFAKALTLAESTKKEDQALLRQILSNRINKGQSIRIGITGSPGVGKSTFIDELGSYLCNTLNKKLAVLAIDPSSVRSGGSILGDKTRMEKLVRNDKAFIRPIPSRNQLGGVSAGLSDAILLCEEFGYEIIFVETVGVGQSEIEVSKLVDIVIYLVLPNSGDDLQAIKRGIMEEVHVLAINKNDGANKIMASQSKMYLENILHLMPSPIENEERKVFLVSALEGDGLSELWNAVEMLWQRMVNSGTLLEKRKAQQQDLFLSILDKIILQKFYEKEGIEDSINKLLMQIKNQEIDPNTAAQKLI